MNLKSALRCGAAATLLATGSANAATINLIDLGGVTGSQAEQGFNIAAAYWSHMLTNTATINLGVKFANLGSGIIGQTGSRTIDYTVQNWENGVNATKSGSTLDQNIVLPTITAGAIDYITSGVDATGGNTTNPA
ncbi:MAG TPA: hypothetical protein VNT42_11800, partial [Sphingomonas sp.]|nr:hypothetical protein [Sphingomonas sp.]